MASMAMLEMMPASTMGGGRGILAGALDPSPMTTEESGDANVPTSISYMSRSPTPMLMVRTLVLSSIALHDCIRSNTVRLEPACTSPM